MSKRASPTLVGAFVLAAAALVVAGVVALGGLRLFRDHLTWVAFFEGDVAGLTEGSPVHFRGVQVGTVKDITIGLDPDKPVAVYLELDPGRAPAGVAPVRTQQDLQPSIERGLRAQLRIVSLVSGQVSVSLDYLPATPVVLTGLEPRLPEVPTVLTQLEQYQARLDKILAALDELDLVRVAQDISEMTRRVGEIARSPELASAIRNAGEAFRSADVALKRLDTQVATLGERGTATLDEIRQAVRAVQRDLEPLAASVSTTLEATRESAESAHGALDRVNRALDGETRLGHDLSQALRQLTAAARSVNALADYLQRHPEALVRGKPGRDSR
jgi:paraquat-inducible protein B